MNLRAIKTNLARSRERMTLGLAALMWRWLTIHERCVAEEAGVERFDLVTIVPTTRERLGIHPWQHLAEELIGLTRDRFMLLLEMDPTANQGRMPRIDRFRSLGHRLSGESILVLDDTWTTGANAQSMAARLKKIGASKVGIVSIGRHFAVPRDGKFRPVYQEYLRKAKRLGWLWNRCCLDHCWYQ
ncbi:phosphoribosyltransferase [Ferrimicrobium sp.]|uniref:phosphoribosyltransferase n=1 Tax=Ferrimicrobium sp. TaxID=2926050 RepID=UPI00260DE6E7|nr:phosphoribosyltransferase [Ferrimicrobium sp.]